MGASLRRASITTCLLAGCSADAPRHSDIADATDAVAVEDANTDVVVAASSSSPPSPRTTTPSLRCDGSPLPVCEGPFTGATCDLPCLGAANDPAPDCGVDVHCHSDGSVYGFATRNALLYAGAPDDPPEIIQADLEGWIVAHTADLSLAPGLARADLGLQPLAAFRSTAGALTIFRFAQTYDGKPVLAPDGLVTVVYGPQGAVSMTGAIIDARVPYTHRDHQATQGRAEVAMLHHASAHLGIPLGQLEVVHANVVAMPMPRTLAWVGFVREVGGGVMLARVIVDADPVLTTPVLPLLSLRQLAAADLANTQPIEVHTVNPAGEPANVTYDVETMLTTGAPLVGSMDDATGQIQLADERIVVLDLHGAEHDELAIHATRVLDPSGQFLEEAGTELSAQVAYHLLQGWYDFIDGHMTDSESAAKRWDSASSFYSNGIWPSDAPAGTYAPRVLASTNASSKDCPVQGTACAGVVGYGAMHQVTLAFPELLHVPAGATSPEALGHVTLPGEHVGPVVLAHEMGHIIDLFTGGGITGDFAPDCGDACALECVEGTTDEAPPLTESIAQLLALVFLRQSFAEVVFDYCPIVDLVAVNGTKPWTPGTCIPPEEDISLFQRVATCDKPPPYCDEPEDVGTRRQCCFDDEDLTNCTIPFAETCQVGASSPSGGVGIGMARAVPTGLCDVTQGYQTNSLYQAFWQLLNGQLCDPSPPFACQAVEWVPGMAPIDATTTAFLYALRINPLTYDQLFEEMARYVSCNYGAAAYAAFNAVACGHGIRDCAAPPPLLCEQCGNGVREGTETCDGTDWLTLRCEDFPEYAGGTLTCDQTTCTLDETQCTMPGLDTTAGTASPPEEPSSSSTAVAETEASSPGGADDGGGCQCRTLASRSPRWLTLFSLALLAAIRRRRNL